MIKLLFFSGGIVGTLLSLFWGLDLNGDLFDQIFWQIRIPRLLLTLLCGGSLSVVGLFFQSIFRNDLSICPTNVIE